MLAGCLVGFSQVTHEGKTIDSIEIDLDGPRTLGTSFILQNLQVETGIPYNPTLVDKSIRNLMSTDAVEDVRVYIDEDKTNEEKVSLVFQVRGKPRIEKILFKGNNKYSDKKLLKAIDSGVGELLSSYKLRGDQKKIENYYLERGYWNSSVDVQVLGRPNDEKISMVYNIIENEKRKISKILFVGNKNISSRKLLKEMETAPWRFWRFWSKRSKYRPSVLEEDLLKLREVYRNEGFLNVEIKQSDIKIRTEGSGKLILQIGLVEGARSFFGKSNLVGNVVLSTEELLEDRVKLEPGDPYSPELLNKERMRLQKKYGEKGYLDARVKSVRIPNLLTKQIDVRFEIIENNKFTVNSILVRGNDKTKTIAIVRELALAPGETFDLRRLETSEARLKNTRFFEKVSLDDEPLASDDPELQNTRRNLVVDVEEGRTGHVSFGIGFSTLEKAMMFAEFRQGNFDLFRWRSPHRLQGDGQKFRLRLKLGARSNEARLAIEEPWFLNRRVAAGFELFREQADYYSSYYDEMRTGFEIYFRKRLFELVEGRIFYRFEDILIDDVSTSSATTFITDPNFGDPHYDAVKNEVKRTISKVGLTLSRDTRDSILFPNEGSILSLRKEFAGGVFGGDSDYGRLELQGARFFKTFEPMDQVLSLVGRTGTLGRFNGEDADVPFFDKFFLGGPYNLRGWDYREAGPMVGGEPVGGNSYSYFGLEYTFKVADPLRFALFYDGGFLRNEDFKFTPGNNEQGWHDNWGLGVRIMVMGMPLRLDLGFPITDPTNTGSSTQFHFSGGSRF